MHRSFGMRSLRCIGLTALLFLGCATPDSSEWVPADVPVNAGRAGDVCAPGAAPDADRSPNAPCAAKRTYYVPDMTANSGNPAGAGGDVSTKSLGILNAGAAATCQGKVGAGFTTCGMAGGNCCDKAGVPAGEVGTAKVVDGFSLDVYEVTSGRLADFVNTFGGNLRSAAVSGKFGAFDKKYASRLPSSRAEVDEELGPACKWRGDVANYGARTWPSPEITKTVATFISDNNERAADIRADATPERLLAKPANCVSYAIASAFCGWQGGRLPLTSEWSYVAVGGGELRTYPWGAERAIDKSVTDLRASEKDPTAFTYPADFPYFDNGFNAYHIAPPGRKPAGASRWGHQDMAGNVLEWMADVPVPNKGIVRGGSWEGHDEKNSTEFVNYDLDRTYGSLGFRCAYGPLPPPPPPAPEVDKVAIYRAKNGTVGDHLQGLIKGEGAPHWVYEGISFWLSKTPLEGTAPLYRCLRQGHHFLSNQVDCEGNVNEGLLGFTFQKERKGAELVYACRDPKTFDGGSTLTPRECTDAGYQVVGTQGYAFASSGDEKAMHH